MSLITHPLVKNFLLVIAIFTASIHAETEDEFIGRAKNAFESKNMDQILSLYGKVDQLTPEQVSAIKSQTELNRDFKQVMVCPALPYRDNEIPSTGKDCIYYLKSEPAGSVFVKFIFENKSSMSSVLAYAKNTDESFSFTSRGSKLIEWKGENPKMYQIQITQVKTDIPTPPIIAVIEERGFTTYMQFTAGNAFFDANRLVNLIIPPTLGTESAAIEITKDHKPFFKKTIDTSKGAIVPIES